jgi:hypothetical protein
VILPFEMLGRRQEVTVTNPARTAWTLWIVLAAAGVAGVIGGAVWLRGELPAVAGRLTLMAAAAVLFLLLAGVLYLRGRGHAALALTALATVACFLTVWHTTGRAIDNVDKVAALDRALDRAGVPDNARLLWVDSRPDSRLAFYFNRPSTYMIFPEDIVREMVDRTQRKTELQLMVLGRAKSLLTQDEPVYLIVERKNYGLMKPSLAGREHLITEVPIDPDDGKKDWIVIANVPPAAPPPVADSPATR